MYTFSTQHQWISTSRLLALTTEAWRGAEIRRRLVENVYVDLPGPLICLEGLRRRKSSF